LYAMVFAFGEVFSGEGQHYDKEHKCKNLFNTFVSPSVLGFLQLCCSS